MSCHLSLSLKKGFQVVVVPKYRSLFKKWEKPSLKLDKFKFWGKCGTLLIKSKPGLISAICLEMSSIEVLTLCHLYDVISHPLYRKCVTVYTHHSAHPSPQGVHPPPHAPSVTSSQSVLPSWPTNTRLHDHEHVNNPQAGSGEWEELPYAHLSHQKINLWKTVIL